MLLLRFLVSKGPILEYSEYFEIAYYVFDSVNIKVFTMFVLKSIEYFEGIALCTCNYEVSNRNVSAGEFSITSSFIGLFGTCATFIVFTCNSLNLYIFCTTFEKMKAFLNVQGLQ